MYICICSYKCGYRGIHVYEYMPSSVNILTSMYIVPDTEARFHSICETYNNIRVMIERKSKYKNLIF